MTKSWRLEGVRRNLVVPPQGRADAQHRRQRAGGPWGKRGFPHGPEPKAEVAG